jgi:prepilin-type N-terminal cleavage/methylation domain-containing protein
MKQQAGFTLVELAVVIFLVGLLASLGLSALNAQMASAAISATKKKQETIKDALISYLGQNKRLPCPAINNDGEEKRDNTAIAGNWDCKADFGIVPYATLGLPKNAALDGWENFFSYAVAKQWTLTLNTTATPIQGGTTTNLAGKAFNVGILGDFIVNDRLPSDPYTAIPISNIKAAVFIVSHGKNGLGAITSKGTQNASPSNVTDEFNNSPNTTTWLATNAFYQRGYTDKEVSTFGAFDDVVLSLNPNDLITPLVKDGALKSAESLWVEQVANIRGAIVGYMFSPGNTNTCAPPASSTFGYVLTENKIPLTDPWGGAITYANQPNICRLKSDGSLRLPISGSCGSTSPSNATSVVVYTIASTVGGTINGPTYTQLISGYPNLLNNCP